MLLIMLIIDIKSRIEEMIMYRTFLSLTLNAMPMVESIKIIYKHQQVSISIVIKSTILSGV
jgi:hypothetical protein